MPILYSAISWYGVPLVDRSIQIGTFRKFGENFHQVFDPDLARASYKWINHIVHVLCCEDRTTFMCIATTEVSKEHAFMMLTELKTQFQVDFQRELQRHIAQKSKPLRYEMESTFGTYLEHTMRRFNKTWDDRSDFAFLDTDRIHIDSVLEVELDPMRTRRRIKNPLLSQETGDIHKGGATNKESRVLGACNRCLLRFPCIMVTICIILGMLVLAYLIFVLPSCGALLQAPNCILFRKGSIVTSEIGTVGHKIKIIT